MKPYQLGLYEKAMPNGASWAEKLTAAKNAGFDFVEISIDETDAKQVRLDWTAGERAEMRRVMEDCGLPIRTMCLSGHRKYPFGSRDAATREKSLVIMDKAIGLACDLGIRIIQLAGYDVYYEEGGEDTRAYFAENLKKAVDMASAGGVIMGFETMETPFMDTISKSMRYVKEMNSPYLGVYPDLGNLNNAMLKYGGKMEDEFAACEGHIFAMHIKETEPGKYRDMHFGEGRVDFVKGIELARRAGVSLFVSECWHDGCEDWQGSIKAVNDFVRSKF